jgi:phthalate 4,5-cis-dihydrodiol dehydrogenase
MTGIGLIGAGHFAAVHARAIATIPRLRLVSVCASDAAAAAAFAATHGGSPCDDWRRVLDNPEVDAVLVATPHHLHAEIAIAAAGAGKHVLVEKPMAPTTAACAAMEAAAAAAGVRLMVGHVMRFVRPCLAAREVLRGGKLGRPLFGSSWMVKLWMESNRRAWHLRPETGGGMLLTAGIHALDRLVWLMDAPVQAVSCMSAHLFHDQPAADTDLLLLRFAGGALGQVASVGYREGAMSNAMELACEGGSLRLDLDRGVSIGQGGHWTDLPGSTEPDWLLRGVAREWEAMLEAMQTGTGPEMGAAEGRHLIACIEAASRANARRCEVEVMEARA